VLAGVPLHGGNLFPRQVPRLRLLVLAYLDALTSLGQAVLAGVALSLGLEAGYFATGYTAVLGASGGVGLFLLQLAATARRRLVGVPPG
jgi:hypothetical protein